MTKKTVIIALALLLVLALLIVGYTMLKDKNERDAEQEQIDEGQHLFQVLR